MTREQAKAIFPDATEEQLKALIDLNSADIGKAKSSVTVAPEKVKVLEEKAKAYDLAQSEKLSVEEKAKQVLADAEKIKAENTRLLNRTKATGILVSGGLSEDDYKDIIDGIVSDDEQTTLTLANNMVKLISSKIQFTEKKVKEDSLKATPPPVGGTGEASLQTTKEQFGKMTYSEREKLLTDSPELYKQLTES